jgi:hypothetical protein
MSFSSRFDCQVVTTLHARQRMQERYISLDLLLEIIETGEVRHQDERRVWIAKQVSGRSDNLLCVAAARDGTLVVKTVMHYFAWETEK